MDDSRIIDQANKVFALRLEAACIYLVNTMRQNVSVPGRKRSIVPTRAGGYRVKWGKLNSEPSKPGEFPRKQVGTFRTSITHEIRKTADGNIEALVGTSYKVGKWLEKGTTKTDKHPGMAARPWLRRTVKEEMSRVDQIMTHGQTVDIKVA